MDDQALEHYGTPRHSGRYPWGSGENPYQRDSGFLGRIQAYKDAGVPEKDIAKLEGITMRELRAKVTLYNEQKKTAGKSRVRNLKEKGYTVSKISEITGINQSTVRNWINQDSERRKNSIAETKAALKAAVDKKNFIDVGKGSEIYLGVSDTRLDAAVKSLVADGYVYHKFKSEQLGTGYNTTYKVLCPPGTTYKDLMTNLENYKLINDPYSTEHRATRLDIKEPVSIDPKRVSIRYAEEGGKDMDGVIQLRRGVEDLSMVGSRYAQVRIKVADDLYLKGMAMYSDDLPKGVDIMFNTNKKKGTPFEDVLKETKDESETSENNPFGATIYQFEYTDKNGKKHQSPLNIVNEEGDWDTWSRTLSSQFMSKQPVPLARRQLEKAYDDKKKEYDDIMKVQNSVVRRKLLEEFSDSCDSDAVNLKAAQLPRQNSQVILPFPGLKENEIYAPNYRDGETVVLVRHPHAGPFEIPTLTVNNKYGPAKEVIKNAKDAVGINPKTAAILSGADFDGDTVVVIPNNQGEIRTKRPLKGLKDFDPQEMYPAYEGMPEVGPKTGFRKGLEMGKISNLITDMTIKGATDDEIAAAVRHSMVVIDAEKHNLDWRQSYQDNDIANLTAKYEGVGEKGRLKGASTAISRAKRKVQVDERAQWFFGKTTIDPETGEKIYRETGRTYQKSKRDKKTGELIRDPETGEVIKEDRVYKYKTEVPLMGEVKDARKISSGGAFEIENVYVDYANKMKALANEARKSWLDAETIRVNKSAAQIYAAEVESLKQKVSNSVKNAPIERYAQLKANLVVNAKIKANPSLKSKENAERLKRLKNQEQARARSMYGSVSRKNRNIKITPREWEAINAHAVTSNLLTSILKNMSSEDIKNLATPRPQLGLTSSQVARAKAMLAGNRTQAEVADALGVSISTLNNYLDQS